MRRLALALALALALLATPAAAMNLSGVPPKFNIPWANAAGGSFITYPVPQASQIGVTPCAASLTDGFPPLSFQALAAGGCGPRGQDFNGIFKQVTLWDQWAGVHAHTVWDSAFASAISGYPLGAVLAQSVQTGCYWVNLVNSNATNPDSGGAGWVSSCPGGGLAPTASTGSANAQVVTATPFKLAPASLVIFKAGFTNTAATTLVVNGGSATAVNRQTPGGLVALSGAEIVNNVLIGVAYDGTLYELVRSASYAYLNVPDQTLSGGVTVTSDALAFAANVPVDCGIGPQQYVPNTGTIAIVAPTSEGSCFLQIENGAGATVPTFTGFVNGGSLGDPIDTVSGHKFVVHVWNIHATPSYFVKALQ